MSNLIIEFSVDRFEIEKLMEKLSDYSLSPYAHAVFAKMTTKQNKEDGQMNIQNSNYQNKLKLETKPWTNPNLSKYFDILTENQIHELKAENKEFNIYPDQIPQYLSEYNPRRIVINSIPVFDKVKSYINDPYKFRGFEIGIEEDNRVKIFASKRDQIAGVLGQRNKKAVELLFESLKDLF